MSLVSELTSADRSILVQTGFRNKLINGSFHFWQRNTTQTTSGFGSDDHWGNFFNGATVTHSRQAFAWDQTEVPGHPLYFSRTVVESVEGATNYVRKEQRIEDCATLAGRDAVLTFWARADAERTIAIDFAQRYGLGLHRYIDPEQVTLTEQWQKHRVRVHIPALTDVMSGYRGTLHVRFWFDAGSSFDPRTGSLGHQSGTFDLAMVQFEEGLVETPFEMRPWGLEFLLCQRYYEKTYNVDVFPGANNAWGGVLTTRQVVGAEANDSFSWRFKVKKATSSSLTVTTYNPVGGGSSVARNVTTNTNCAASAESVAAYTGHDSAIIPFVTATGSSAGNLNIIHAAVEAELQ